MAIALRPGWWRYPGAVNRPEAQPINIPVVYQIFFLEFDLLM